MRSGIRIFWGVPVVALVAAVAIQPAYADDAAEELVREFDIPTAAVSREQNNLYSTRDGRLVRTRYCNIYAHYEDAVTTDEKLIFIEDGEVCDIEGVYRE